MAVLPDAYVLGHVLATVSVPCDRVRQSVSSCNLSQRGSRYSCPSRPVPGRPLHVAGTLSHAGHKQPYFPVVCDRVDERDSTQLYVTQQNRDVTLQRLLSIYCPGHAEVSGNERADRLASTADSLQLGRAEGLRGPRNFLNMDWPQYYSIGRLKERGVEKGSGRHSTLQGRERSVFNQTNIRTVSRATLGRLLRDWAGRVWAFPSATMSS